eukprot:779816_1
MALCQDVNRTVRIATCQQLDIISRSFGLEYIESQIMDELEQQLLLNDEKSGMKHESLRTVVLLLVFIPQSTRVDKALPVLKSLSVAPPSEARCVYVELSGQVIIKINADGVAVTENRSDVEISRTDVVQGRDQADAVPLESKKSPAAEDGERDV